MRKSIESLDQWEALLGPDPLSEVLRGKVRELIFTLVEAELREVLAAMPYECNGARPGDRHGKRKRSMSTGLGQTVIELARARLSQGVRRRNGKVGWLSDISGGRGRWTVPFGVVTSAERTGGASAGRYLPFCAVRRFPRARSRG